MLGGLTQQRVSQLLREGFLVAQDDGSGRLQYDRDVAEKLARARAVRRAESPEEAETRKLEQDESRERFRRTREREAALELQRQQHLDELAERAVLALEKIAKCILSR